MNAAVIAHEELGLCPVCEKSMSVSMLTDSRIEAMWSTLPIVVSGQGHLHIHNVAITDYDGLTVRASVRRLVLRNRLRLRWKMRWLTPIQSKEI